MILISITAKCRQTRGEIMRLKNITLAGIILLVLAFTVGMAGATDQNATVNETPAVNETGTPTATPVDAGVADENNTNASAGLFGPGNALYGLGIAFENIGETFTFNTSEKLGKQVSHARQRIAEVRAALRRNDTDAADKALAQYEAKMDAVNETMSKLSDNDTGLINAQKEIAKHQVILEQLLVSHPNSTGIQRAYNNSIRHEEKFKLNIQRKSEQIENMGTVIEVKEERKESKESINDNKTEAKTEHNESVTTESSNRGQSRRS
jgi:hypothetical protein